MYLFMPVNEARTFAAVTIESLLLLPSEKAEKDA